MSANVRTPRRARRHSFGWLPDLPDHRDFPFAASHPRPPSVPTAVDLRATCSPIEDQGALGSCTSQALAGALEFLEMKDGAAFQDLSRLFIYYNERVILGTTGSDSGARPHIRWR